MKYIITTELDVTIVNQTIESSDPLISDSLEVISRQMADISDMQTRQALICLGWIPPRWRERERQLMMVRRHRGTLAESMKTAEVIEATEAALLEWVRRITTRVVILDDLDLSDGQPDDRIGWSQSWLVSIKGYGVVGMADFNPES